jgi:membrane peptidoglycan carboxypeptidase
VDGGPLPPTRLLDRTRQTVLYTFQNPAAAASRPLRLAAPGEAPSADTFAPALVTATLAIFDPSLWSHLGFERLSLAERLATETLLWREPPDRLRWLRGRLLAYQITQTYGPAQVLTWFLNNADFGAGVFGADAAARVYLGKSAADLSLAEAAVLVAAAEAPALNPLDAPAASLTQTADVLGRLFNGGWINTETVLAARRERIEFQPDRRTLPAADAAFIRLALEQATASVPRAHLARGGYVLVTTLDADLQAAAICTTAAQLAQIQGGTAPADCETARRLSGAPTDPSWRDLPWNAAALTLDAATGQILALTGPSNPHQPLAAGTILSPIIYLHALARGYTPATLLWDLPPDGGGLGPVRLRTALANDLRAPAADLLAQFGPQELAHTAHQLGLAQAQTFDLTTTRTTLLEVGQVYAALAGAGVGAGWAAHSDDPLQPTALLRLEDEAGNLLPDGDWSTPRIQAVTSPQLAYLLTHILADEAARWRTLPHPNPLELGRPAAAKIGRAPDGRAAWTAGFTGTRVGVTWIGLAGGDAGALRAPLPPTLAADLWRALILAHLPGDTPSGWPIPSGIVSEAVCDPSGLLPTAACPAVVTEVFLDGTTPTQPDNLYGVFALNRETGRLATVLTPLEQIEERIFLLVPPEAQLWARQAGLDLPPQDYDVVAPAQAPADATISAPTAFSALRGQVAIRGRAAGTDFATYRVEVGSGVQPRHWLQVGEDHQTAVRDGVLATWDTTGLEGLYALKLLVIDRSQNVQTQVVPVTIDNQPPEVTILAPAADSQLAPLPARLTLRAAASDNLALARLDFILDGARLGSLTGPPYAWVWTPTVGPHRFEVVALDQAGNESRAAVTFTVAAGK